MRLDVIKEFEKSISHLKELQERASAPYRRLAEVDKALRESASFSGFSSIAEELTKNNARSLQAITAPLLRDIEKTNSHLKELQERASAPYLRLAEVGKALRESASFSGFSSIVEELTKNNARSLQAITEPLLRDIEKSGIRMKELQEHAFAPYLRVAEVDKALRESASFGGLSSKLKESLDQISFYSKEAIAFSPGSSFQQRLNEISKSAYLPRALETFAKKENFPIALEIVLSNQEFPLPDETSSADGALEGLTSADNPHEFRESFSKLPPLLQQALIGFFLLVILPICNNIASNILTPKVEGILEAPEPAKRDKVKQIKELDIGLDLSNHRFVLEKKGLTMRQRPREKSGIVARLEFGKVVRLVSTQGDWAEITYGQDDGENHHGWVFRRYLGKFRAG
jgi:hypothetical protein